MLLSHTSIGRICDAIMKESCNTHSEIWRFRACKYLYNIYPTMQTFFVDGLKSFSLVFGKVSFSWNVAPLFFFFFTPNIPLLIVAKELYFNFISPNHLFPKHVRLLTVFHRTISMLDLMTRDAIIAAQWDVATPLVTLKHLPAALMQSNRGGWFVFLTSLRAVLSRSFPKAENTSESCYSLLLLGECQDHPFFLQSNTAARHGCWVFAQSLKSQTL